MRDTKIPLFCFFVCCLFTASGLRAQSLTPRVVATAGAVFSTKTLSVEWTLGEVMTETYADGLVLTQGFHQPGLGIISSTDTPNLAEAGVRVYPNPVSGHLRVDLPPDAKLLGLHDAAGQMTAVRFGGPNGHRTANLSALPAGMYFLRIQLADGRTHARRLVKD